MVSIITTTCASPVNGWFGMSPGFARANASAFLYGFDLLVVNNMDLRRERGKGVDLNSRAMSFERVRRRGIRRERERS